MTYAQLRVPNRPFYTPEPHPLRPTSYSDPHLYDCYSWVVEHTLNKQSIFHSYTADQSPTMPLFLLDSIEEDEECVMSTPHIFSKSAPAEQHCSQFAHSSNRRNSPSHSISPSPPPHSPTPNVTAAAASYHSSSTITTAGYGGTTSPVMSGQPRPLPTVYEDETEESEEGQTNGSSATRRSSTSSSSSSSPSPKANDKDSCRLRRNYAFSDLRQLRL